MHIMCNSTNVNVIVTICRAEVSRISHLGEICDARCGSRLSEITYMQGTYDSMSDLGEIRVYQRADFQSGSRVLKKVF